MADIQKQNISVTPGSLQIEMSGGYITAISGKPIAGGSGGGTQTEKYYGDNINVQINYDTNTISLTPNTTTLIYRDIPTKVSDLTDSASYPKKIYVDNTFQTKDAMSAYWTSAETTEVFDEEITTLVELINGKQNKLTFSYDNDKISAINGSALAGQGGTTYSAGQYINIDSNDTISVTGVLALDEYAQYEPVLMGDANITATSSKVDNHTQWNLAINSTPVVTDTKLVGENSITAHTTNVSGEWLVGLEQTAHNAIASIDGISTDVGTLKTSSAGWNEVTSKLDKSIYSNASGNWEASYNVLTAYSAAGTWLTAHQSLTNYYTKNETSGAGEIENALTGKQDKLTFAGESNTITSINNSAVGGGTSFTGVTTAGSISGDGLTNPLGLVTSAEQALAAVDGKVSKPTASQQQLVYVVWDKGPAQHWTDFGVAANSWANTFLFDEEYPIVNGNNGLSAGLAPGEYNDVYEVGIDTTNMADNKQYAFTTTGWAEVQAGTSFTGVTTGTGLSGTGLSNSPLGVDTTAAIYFTNGSAKSAVSAESATNALSSRYSKQLQDASKIIEIKDVTALQNWASSNSSTWNDVTAKLGTAQYALDSATFVTSSNSTIIGTDKYALTTAGWASVETAYLPLTGGTVTGQMTLTGTSWDNKLTIGRSNSAIDIGVASNGALTLKANVNNACQFNMMQTGASGVDINITYGQTPSAIGNLYVMKTHTTAEATTASGSWNGDNLLHIILDS